MISNTQPMTPEMPDWVTVPEPPASIRTDTSRWSKSDFKNMAKKGQVIVIGPTGWSNIIQSSAVQVVIKGGKKS